DRGHRADLDARGPRPGHRRGGGRPVIDGHVHFWRYDPAAYPWIDARMGALARDFLPDDLARAASPLGVDGVVAVQAQPAVAETEWLLQLAGGHPPVGGVGGGVGPQAAGGG